MGKNKGDKNGQGLLAFYKKVDMTNSDGCWLWTGSKRGGRTKGGRYGAFNTQNRPVYAHRFAYEIFFGDIESELTVDHLCGQHLCVRPDHMEVVTLVENVRRGWETRRRRLAEAQATA